MTTGIENELFRLIVVDRKKKNKGGRVGRREVQQRASNNMEVSLSKK